MARSWAQKAAGAKPPHVAVLEKPYAGLPAGSRLFIASPALIAEEIASVPQGETCSVAALRDGLARRHGADATCPTSTGIFLRIVAEMALERLAAGAPPAAVTPFWRVVEPASPLAAKLSCGAETVARLRAAEALQLSSSESQ